MTEGESVTHSPLYWQNRRMVNLKRLFARTRSDDPSPSLALAVAQLLIEIARADLGIASSEMAAIRAHLKQAYGLNDTQLDGLVAQAQTHVDQAVSLHDTVKALNDSLNADDKARLIGALWHVAYADQRLDPYEEALLRRLADLLHVPHSVFIREKLQKLG